jgi:tRNA (guanine37-N1)-methyltransferase
MRIDVVTIFPAYFAPLSESLIGKARDRGVLDLRLHQLRDWTHDLHHTVDDSPYGGGPGMLMTPEPWAEAIESVALAESPPPRLIFPTPSGRPFTQALAEEYAAEPWLAFGCGRYEGIDARVAEWAASHMQVDEVSVGDYVLAGGEAAVLVMVEAVARLLPGVLGNSASAREDSFSEGFLEAPAYTRPEVWRGRSVPSVLLSGNHRAIAGWRREEALRRTAERRPDLLAAVIERGVGARDREVLAEAGFPLPEDGVA